MKCVVQKGKLSIYRRAALWVACAFRTWVVAEMLPIELLVIEQQKLWKERQNQSISNSAVRWPTMYVRAHWTILILSYLTYLCYDWNIISILLIIRSFEIGPLYFATLENLNPFQQPICNLNAKLWNSRIILLCPNDFYETIYFYLFISQIQFVICFLLFTTTELSIYWDYLPPKFACKISTTAVLVPLRHNHHHYPIRFVFTRYILARQNLNKNNKKLHTFCGFYFAVATP